jgi:Skp family chaperone for outer membrane proteins
MGEAAIDTDDANLKNVSCTRHSDKLIEYFCKTCTLTVCVKCIFDEHNGHELV